MHAGAGFRRCHGLCSCRGHAVPDGLRAAVRGHAKADVVLSVQDRSAAAADVGLLRT